MSAHVGISVVIYKSNFAEKNNLPVVVVVFMVVIYVFFRCIHSCRPMTRVVVARVTFIIVP